mmetsp:Transcript_18589/g.43638  ORF Transcript_18589/g.43638 Transcript_18589/m.43638 type:complete len:355 (-) Transcript_18589:1109-2173(-)
MLVACVHLLLHRLRGFLLLLDLQLFIQRFVEQDVVLLFLSQQQELFGGPVSITQCLHAVLLRLHEVRELLSKGRASLLLGEGVSAAAHGLAVLGKRSGRSRDAALAVVEIKRDLPLCHEEVPQANVVVSVNVRRTIESLAHLANIVPSLRSARVFSFLVGQAAVIQPVIARIKELDDLLAEHFDALHHAVQTSAAVEDQLSAVWSLNDLFESVGRQPPVAEPVLAHPRVGEVRPFLKSVSAVGVRLAHLLDHGARDIVVYGDALHQAVGARAVRELLEFALAVLGDFAAVGAPTEVCIATDLQALWPRGRQIDYLVRVLGLGTFSTLCLILFSVLPTSPTVKEDKLPPVRVVQI